MTRDLGYVLGLVCGGILGIIFVIFFQRWTKKDHDVKCKYDERQTLVIGRGYKRGFWTLVSGIILYGIIDSGREIRCIETMAVLMFIVAIGIMVFIGYCIWHEGYFALNENRKRVLAGFLLCSLMNFAIFTMNVFHGNVIKDGVIQFEIIHLVWGILFIFIFLMVLAKTIRDRREDD